MQNGNIWILNQVSVNTKRPDSWYPEQTSALMQEKFARKLLLLAKEVCYPCVLSFSRIFYLAVLS